MQKIMLLISLMQHLIGIVICEFMYKNILIFLTQRRD